MSDRNAVDLNRLGGEPAVAEWVRLFYARVAADPLLAPMFHDLESARAKQLAYFVEFFGGPKRYTEAYGRAFLRYKHRHFRIGQAERDAWMQHVMAALREVVTDAAVLAEVERRLGELANHMINHHPERQDAYYFQQ